MATKSARASRLISSSDRREERYWSVTWTRETAVISNSSFSSRWRRRSRGPSKTGSFSWNTPPPRLEARSEKPEARWAAASNPLSGFPGLGCLASRLPLLASDLLGLQRRGQGPPHHLGHRGRPLHELPEVDGGQRLGAIGKGVVGVG